MRLRGLFIASEWNGFLNGSIPMDDQQNLEETQANTEQPGSNRDPEERPAENKEDLREKMLDKTLADSFPTSDPPSSIPDPAEDDSFAA
jgi:hypothetical protein